MKKLFSNSIFRAVIASLLVLCMCAIQYESGVSDYKFWIASIVIFCVMIYLLILISGLVKKNKTLEKELTQYKSRTSQLEVEDAHLIE
jgi:hypothetical protein